ncbi:hypothetical protein [Methanolobus halotolerans]|uniref:Uncharacterized protein n=1 Tax=Methanolobus halotolerans TaxID=2052935 RepID=A0A4E0QZ16_9EURY|nr:hypothetical protein [Methanolobus halotolerans]TGC08964.1 hypothetical protein CUN85_08000 [Methanolobus halotolerans]
MAFAYTITNEIACFHPKTDFLHRKKSKSTIAFDPDRNYLNHDLIYLKGNEGTCYWMDSKGLRIHFCHVGTINDISLEDINSILTTVLASVYFFDEEYIFRFAKRLFSKMGDAFDMGSDPDGTIDVLLGWKSIALLILSSDHYVKASIGVRIGQDDYGILS